VSDKKQREWGMAFSVNGTNLDDLGDYRPGLTAARDASVTSPLIDAGFTKADVRLVAEHIGLTVWNKPAAACLSSRIPYGSSVTVERLAQIGGLEAELRALGLARVRVRWHDTIARIEVEANDLARLIQPEIRTLVLEAGKRHGFAYVTLDLAGYRQGSHNEVLVGKSLRIVTS
jgi:pyridinium-3,5-biscarboxylic acid mononucleotide sulfurtransferase